MHHHKSGIQNALSKEARPTLETKQHRNVRSGKGSRLELQGTVYKSGSTLSLNPEVINAASIKLKSINLNHKNPSFTLGKREDTRHFTLVLNTTLSFTTQKQIVAAKKASSSNYLMFVTALAIRLGNLSCFILLTSWNPQVPQSKRNIKTCKNTPHTTHHCSYVRIITKYRHTHKELDLLFADSLFLIRYLLKENKQLLRKTDGTIPNENLRDIYKCPFQSEFDISRHGSRQSVVSVKPGNNSNTMILSTVQKDVQYLDKAHNRLFTFNSRLYDDSDNSE